MRLRMTCVQIIGLKTHLMPVVHVLHQLGCVQIDDIAEAGDVSARPLHLDPETVRTQEELGYLVARIEGLLSTLDAGQIESGAPIADQAAGERPISDCVAEARAGLDTLGPSVQSLVSRREALEAEQASLPRYEAVLRKLLPIAPPSARDAANISIGVLVSRGHLGVLDAIAERVLNLTGGRAEIAAQDVDATMRAMLMVIPREFAGEVEALLGREDISRLRLPAGFADQPPDAAVAALSRRIAAIPLELSQIKTELASLAEEWGPRLARWRASLRECLEEFAILSRLGETDLTFVLVGWTPERDVPRARRALRDEVGPAVVMQTLSLAPEDRRARTPVALANPGPARPFQSLVRMIALPRYEGIDPTLLMTLCLPLFFGMILGDVGYGALLFLLCLAMLRRFRQPGALRDLVQVVMMGSAWGVVFGFLYGEAFGTLGEKLGLHPIWIDRTSADQVAGLLLFTVAVGAVHVTLGLVLGVWEAFRERSRHLLLERGGMLVGLIGLFLIVSVAVKWLPAGFMTPGAVVLIVGIALLGSSLGWLGLLMGPIEFIGLVGNILSYLRIAAIGLASVYLARVANDLAGSVGNVVVGVIIAVLIHALNLALGAFSPTIHSLRLHYVEFFRKFYEGGGRPFEPFGRTT
ncbi:MAG TPA: V-type ATP synthase subunit I [Anaerolineae bacterium]|nr:V-type ATP synthase subunit I [Anaerolineae bacterium]